MRKILLTIFFIAPLLLTQHIYADIYRSVDSNGVITFSDQPSGNAETVILTKENVAIEPEEQKKLNTDNTNASTVDQNGKETKHVPYTRFVITSPKDQDTFQNATEVPVTVDMTPALQKGDKIQYFLDGIAVSEQITSTSFSIPKLIGIKDILERGTHTLTASIFDANGDIVSTTPPITIFLHYASINFPPSRN